MEKKDGGEREKKGMKKREEEGDTTILSKSCPITPHCTCAVKFSSSSHRMRSISLVSTEMTGLSSSGGHSRAPDTLVPPMKGKLL